MTATALQSIIPFDQIVHFDLVWQPFGIKEQHFGFNHHYHSVSQ